MVGRRAVGSCHSAAAAERTVWGRPARRGPAAPSGTGLPKEQVRGWGAAGVGEGAARAWRGWGLRGVGQ